MTTRPPFAPGSLTWAVGIEDTCVYPPDGTPPLDEHALTGHDEVWRDDLALAGKLGATAVRYGVSWPLAHPAPGTFDWDRLDAVAEYAVDHLGLTLVADLVHYGTPRWLPGSFADPRYPDAVAEFAGALAERYAGRITHFTPLNEPVTTASFCGLRGIWPPRRTGWDGWTAVAVPIAAGIARAARAIRAAQPRARIVHVEAATQVRTDEPALREHARFLAAIGWLPTDLALGRVTGEHPMRGWLLEHGADPGLLDRLVAEPAHVDLMGVNYYPDLTPRALTTAGGDVLQVAHDRGALGLREALLGFRERYGLPLVLTETSVEGDDERREAWLTESVAEVRRLRAEGLDVRGYTWWPLLDFVDWSWAAGGANVEEFAVARTADDGSVDIGPAPPLGDPSAGKTPFLRRMGLVRLREDGDGRLERQPTRVADGYAAHAQRLPEEDAR
ncbi:family 1 glycosylhydrolase [Jiangella alba]|uniref:Beta-glucosidase/6-phospho-beta-glucosidase/beta-galactosidase n=1 Tax=Jiangella alba TaxID=561176 RepID=A0A1H5K3R1_9ACTN|nr:family 1 glycosylhydrolase [Jiangella alba]SEE59320.1 Beta-glucosidase/6-phospho-beta-glucosidase/beta-galactosidase [Jiangella alba]